jgi:hypothetical protein
LSYGRDDLYKLKPIIGAGYGKRSTKKEDRHEHRHAHEYTRGQE